MKVDRGLSRAFRASEGTDGDADDDEGREHGRKIIGRLRDALEEVGTRVIDVFKQFDENGDGSSDGAGYDVRFFARAQPEGVFVRVCDDLGQPAPHSASRRVADRI